jgi:hypothetical protein
LLNEIDWVSVLVHFIIIWVIVIFIVYIRKTSLNSTVKYFINIAAIIFVFLTVLEFFGYQFSIIFRLIEWATKFVLPWVALYWLVRAIKVLDKKS